MPHSATRHVRFEVSLRSMLTALALAALVWTLLRIEAVLLAVFVALILAGTLAPAVEALERRRVSRAVGVGIVFVASLAVVATLALVTVPSLVRQVSGIIAEAPALQARAVAWLGHSRLGAPLAGSLRNVQVSALMRDASGSLLAVSSRVVEGVAYGATTVVLALYMVADRDRVRGMAYAVVPREYHLRLARIMLNLETIVGGYMRGQLITSAAMAAFTFVLLTACGVRNALPLAVFAGLTDVLPLIGALLALAPCVLSALARGPVIAVVVFALMVTYQEFESRVLVPRIYGHVLRLAPVTVLVALLVGAELLGVLGALLALPVAAGLRMILEELRVSLPGDDTDDSTLRARDAVAEEEFLVRAAGTAPEEAAAVAVEMAVEIRREDAADPADAARVPITSGEP